MQFGANLVGEKDAFGCIVSHIVHTRVADEVHTCVIGKLNCDFLEKKFVSVEIFDYKSPRFSKVFLYLEFYFIL